MKYNFIFYYPSIESGGLEKNLFFLINSLAEKNYKCNFITYEITSNRVNLKKNFIFIKILV